MADTPEQTAAKNEEAVFGANPPRGPDGKPLERGRGSNWAAMSPAARTHYLSVEVQAAADLVVNQAKALADAAGKFAAAYKTVVAAAAEAKDAPMPPAERIAGAPIAPAAIIPAAKPSVQ